MLSLQLLQASAQPEPSCPVVSIGSAPGDVLVTTGATVYSVVQKGVRTIQLTFVAEHFIPSYLDRYRVTDSFALSLPTELGSLLRYDSIAITDERYLDFSYSWMNGLFYAYKTGVLNSLISIPG